MRTIIQQNPNDNFKNVCSSTIFKLITLFFLVFVTSCSKDEDEVPAQIQHFVNKITSSSTVIAGLNQVVAISYNNKNKISNYSFTYSSGESVTNAVVYNSNNLISKITSVITSGVSSTTKVIDYSYTNDKLTSIAFTSSPSTTPSIVNVIYDGEFNGYRGVIGVLIIFELFMDSNNNIQKMLYDSNEILIGHNEKSGLFTDSSNVVALNFATLLLPGVEPKFAAQFFATKEISKITINANILSGATTRNENNLINSTTFSTPASTTFSINANYESRNVN